MKYTTDRISVSSCFVQMDKKTKDLMVIYSFQDDSFKYLNKIIVLKQPTEYLLPQIPTRKSGDTTFTSDYYVNSCALNNLPEQEITLVATGNNIDFAHTIKNKKINIIKSPWQKLYDITKSEVGTLPSFSQRVLSIKDDIYTMRGLTDTFTFNDYQYIVRECPLGIIYPETDSEVVIDKTKVYLPNIKDVKIESYEDEF